MLSNVDDVLSCVSKAQPRSASVRFSTRRPHKALNILITQRGNLCVSHYKLFRTCFIFPVHYILCVHSCVCLFRNMRNDESSWMGLGPMRWVKSERASEQRKHVKHMRRASNIFKFKIFPRGQDNWIKMKGEKNVSILPEFSFERTALIWAAWGSFHCSLLRVFGFSIGGKYFSPLLPLLLAELSLRFVEWEFVVPYNFLLDSLFGCGAAAIHRRVFGVLFVRWFDVVGISFFMQSDMSSC